MNPLVSIIVSVYNVENYIEKCIDSVLNQEYENIEVLVINDGTRDDSINKIARVKDSRLNIFNKRNGGVSDARNYGLKRAAGEYIYFIDSDDWAEENLISLCMSYIEDNEILYFNYFTDTWNRNEELIKREESLLHRIDDDNEKNILSISGYVWNKFYKRSFLEENNLSFNKDLHLYEDIDFNLKCFIKSEKIIFLEKALYHYNNRPINSLIKSYNPNNVLCFNEIQKTLKNYLGSKKYSKDMKMKIISDCILTAVRHELNTVYHYTNTSFSEKTNIIRSFLNEFENINYLKDRKTSSAKELIISKLAAYDQAFLLNIVLSLKK